MKYELASRGHRACRKTRDTGRGGRLPPQQRCSPRRRPRRSPPRHSPVDSSCPSARSPTARTTGNQRRGGMMGTVGGTAQGHRRDAPPSVHRPEGPPTPPHLALLRPTPPAPRPHPRLAQGARHPRRTDNHPGAHDVCDIRARLVAAGAAQRAGPSRPPSPRPRRRRPGPPPRRILSSAPPSAHPPRASPWSDRPPPAQRCCGSAGMWGHFGSRFRPV